MDAIIICSLYTLNLLFHFLLLFEYLYYFHLMYFYFHQFFIIISWSCPFCLMSNMVFRIFYPEYIPYISKSYLFSQFNFIVYSMVIKLLEVLFIFDLIHFIWYFQFLSLEFLPFFLVFDSLNLFRILYLFPLLMN